LRNTCSASPTASCPGAAKQKNRPGTRQAY
jgi:hypothetical protein